MPAARKDASALCLSWVKQGALLKVRLFSSVPCLFCVFFFFLQLFRRVAAALPGMESTQDKSREDSILYLPSTGGESLSQLADIPKKEGHRGK